MAILPFKSHKSQFTFIVSRFIPNSFLFQWYIYIYSPYISPYFYKPRLIIFQYINARYQTSSIPTMYLVLYPTFASNWSPHHIFIIYLSIRSDLLTLVSSISPDQSPWFPHGFPMVPGPPRLRLSSPLAPSPPETPSRRPSSRSRGPAAAWRGPADGRRPRTRPGHSLWCFWNGALMGWENGWSGKI